MKKFTLLLTAVSAMTLAPSSPPELRVTAVFGGDFFRFGESLLFMSCFPAKEEDLAMVDIL